MKKIILTTLCCLLITTGAFAQRKPVVLPLDKKTDVTEIESLGEQGFLVKTAASYAGREKNVQIHSFTNELKKRWTVKLEKPTNTMLEYTLLASPYSPHTYYIQASKTFSGSKGVLNITRIDSLGKKKDIVYKVSKEFSTASRVAMFADEDALYILTAEETVNKDRDIKKNKVKNKKESILVFYVLKSDKTTMQRVETEIKLVSDLKDADLFVEYLGHDEDNIFLSRKSVNLSENEIEYEILTLDKNFSTVDVSNFKIQTENPLVPSVNMRSSNGASIYNNDYDVTVTRRGNTIITTYTANAGSFGCAKLDVNTGHFYIYGLTAAKPSSKNTKKKDTQAMVVDAHSAFVSKFDFNTGDLIDQQEFDLSKEFLADKLFETPYLFVNRVIWMDVLNENTYKLCGAAGENVHVMIVPIKGTKTEYVGRKIEFQKGGGNYHRRFLANALGNKSYMSDEQVKFMKKYPEFREKEYSIFGIFLGDRTVIVRNTAYTKQPQLEFNLFNHK